MQMRTGIAAKENLEKGSIEVRMREHHSFRTKTLVVATLLAVGGGVQAAEPAKSPSAKKGVKRADAAPTNEQLQKRLEDLQQTVEALKQQLKEQAAATPAAAPAAVAAPAAPAAVGAATEGQAARELVTRDDLDGLRADLENYKYSQQRDRERKTALTTRGSTIFGTVQVRGTWTAPSTSGNTTSPNDARHSSFDVPLAQLGIRGSLFRDYSEGKNLDYQLLFGYTPNVASGYNGSASQTNGVTNTAFGNGSQFNLLDAYVNYSPLPTTTGLEEDKLSIRFGQQLIPYGLDAQVGEDLRPTIFAAQFLGAGSITKNAAGVPVAFSGGHSVGLRQIGLVVRGDTHPYVDYAANYRAPLFEYNLGIVNGSTLNKSDDNGQKDYIGRVAFTLPVDYNSWFRELKFGTSFYKGKANLAAAATAGGTQTFQRVGRNERYGFDIYYNHNPFGVTYEYSEGKNDAVADVTFARSTIKSKGQYLTFFGQWGEQFLTSIKSQGKFDDFWPKSLQLFLRFDRFDPNTKITANDTWTTTAGANFFFAETTKFQVNFVHTDNRQVGVKDSNALLGQFQYGF